MKVTIDVPAPSQLLELVSRLRSKNRNYKTQLKQLQRAHFITKTLYKNMEQNYLVLLERMGRQSIETQRLRDELDSAQYSCRIPSPSPYPVNEKPEGESYTEAKFEPISDHAFDHPI